VILVGAGHAHLYVAAHADTLIERGARVVLIDPTGFWYSGLATGMLGGMYDSAEDQVDSQRLIEAHGGTFIRDHVEAIDVRARQLRLASGDVLDYDYVSINVGSRVNVSTIPGTTHDPSVWSVKPVVNLWKLRKHLEAKFRARETLQIVVVGGGSTGSEVTANLIALAVRHDSDLRPTLVTSSDRLIPQAPLGAARTLQQNLTRRGVVIHTHTHIVRREGKSLIVEDGRHIEADVVILAHGLEANPFVQATGLPTQPKDGLRINAMLHSIADERVFAAGDCAAMEDFQLP